MPEGDTIYRSARALGRVLTGKTITGFEAAVAALAAADDERAFVGQCVTRVESRGKWLLIHLSAGTVVATHMLMSGSWHIYRVGERWRLPRRDLRVLIETAEFVAVGFRIPVVRVYTAESIERELRIPVPESDVLRGEFSVEGAVARLATHGEANPAAELADALLNQRLLAGVGNVFKSEICFLAGLSPFSPLRTLHEAELTRVVNLARKLLSANVLEDSDDRIVTYTGRHRRTTHSADPGASLWVYGRSGEPCRVCRTGIERCLQGADARSTYWCPQCQETSLKGE